MNKCVGVGVGLSFVFSHVPVVVVLKYSFTVFPTHVPTHTPQIHALNTRAVVSMAEAKLKLPEMTTMHTCASKFSFIHSFIFFLSFIHFLFFCSFFLFFLTLSMQCIFKKTHFDRAPCDNEPLTPA